MKAVTVRYLRARGACADQVDLFIKTFGKKAELTRGNLVKAALVDLDLQWLAIWGQHSGVRYHIFERGCAQARYARDYARAWVHTQSDPDMMVTADRNYAKAVGNALADAWGLP